MKIKQHNNPTDETVVSEINSILTLGYLKNKPENQYFERKSYGKERIKPTKIAEELVGMLNSDGGVLAFGITDDGEFENLKDIDTELDAYRSLPHDFIKPSCNVRLEEIYIDENLIFLYHVEQDIERLYMIKDNEKVFLRVQDTNRKLDRDAVRKLEYDKTIRKFEEELVDEFEIDDLDNEGLASYKERLNYQGSALDLLKNRYLVIKKDSKYHFKNSSLLLFANDPEKYIPSASVRYVRYKGKEALTGFDHNVVKDERFAGNIPKLIDEVKKFLNITFNDYYFLDIEEGIFRKVPEYPEEAWLEGVVNALCHRSYNSQGNAIYIKHFDDRLEISNSGPLPAQVTIENIKTERFARNPRIARVLEDMGYVRQLNEGVARIYESMEKSMLSVPEYRVVNGNVYLTLKNKIREHSKTISENLILKIEKRWKLYNNTQRLILQHLFLNQSSTKLELAEVINVHKDTISKYLSAFVSEGILDRLSKKERDPRAVYCFKNG